MTLTPELNPLMAPLFLLKGEVSHFVSGPFVAVSPFVKEKVPTLSAQALREQFILRQIENKADLYETKTDWKNSPDLENIDNGY